MSERKHLFRAERCDFCGRCFSLCPVMRLPLNEAAEEMKRLAGGGESLHVLQQCTSCMSCNLYCPADARPYSLIQERWNERYRREGAPPLYEFVCPTRTPNIWQLLNLFLDEKERAWITEWMDRAPAPGDTVLLVGSYVHLFPFIIGGSALLDHFCAVDRLDHWEAGAYLYQGGYLDEVRRIAEHTRDDMARWGACTVVSLLDAVHNLYSRVHPEEMGVTHQATFVNFRDWLLDRMKDGTVRVRRPLDITVTVHDNCYSKPFGPECWDAHREILSRCGCTLVEMEHHRENSLCCGFGKGASWTGNFTMPFEIIAEGAKKIREAEKTGAAALVSYCGGCIYLLWAARELLGSRIDIYHSVEIVRMAMGEDLDYPRDHLRRAWDVIAIITYQLAVSLFRKNFRIDAIGFDAERSTFRPGKRLFLRMLRRAFDVKPVRRAYAALFRLLMPVPGRRSMPAAR